MELYIKAGPKDGDVGDCPFAHYVRCVLNYKKLEYKSLPCKPDSKPDWLIKELEGKMPCLKQGNLKMVESGTIAEYLEKTYPEPSLSIENMEEICKIQSGFFPAMAKLVKSTDYQEDLEQELMDQLKILNDHLEKDGFKYFAGSHVSLVDFNLGPKLYHMDIALKEFYPEIHDKMKTFTALNCYMETIFNEQAFKDSSYPKETILWGWSAARAK